jgi:DNA-binding transcriptional ArsR family regulator
MPSDRERKEMRNLLKFLFFSSRGGLTRLKVVELLARSQLNANQISKEVGIDYKTVSHHLDVLVRHRIIVREGEGYGSTYRISRDFLPYMEILEELKGSTGRQRRE